MRKRLTIKQQYPHIIKLPKNAKSPTNSVYGRFDIVKQTKAVNTFSNAALTVRCAEPFTLLVLVGKKIKQLESKVG